MDSEVVLWDIQHLQQNWALPLPDQCLPKSKPSSGGQGGGAPLEPSRGGKQPGDGGSKFESKKPDATNCVTNMDYEDKYKAFQGKFTSLAKKH